MSKITPFNKTYKFPEDVAQAAEDVRQMYAEKTDPPMLPILLSEYEDLKRKAAALDWLEEAKAEVERTDGMIVIYAEAVGTVYGSGNLLEMTERAMGIAEEGKP